MRLVRKRSKRGRARLEKWSDWRSKVFNNYFRQQEDIRSIGVLPVILHASAGIRMPRTPIKAIPREPANCIRVFLDEKTVWNVFDYGLFISEARNHAGVLCTVQNARSCCFDGAIPVDLVYAKDCWPIETQILPSKLMRESHACSGSSTSG